MTASRWGEIKSILAEVLEQQPAHREAALDRLCGEDSDLRGEVESLLAFEQQAGAMLDSAVAPGAALRPDLAAAPESIGPYKILREIGRGGMGVVYLGERADGEYRKQVAIKLITTGRGDQSMVRRFRRERQILAQLEHPGIARLLDGGATAEGQPYFVMEYSDGFPLLKYCGVNQLSLADRLDLFLEICGAVAHAHQRLIVHRDLKPGNILVAGGHPKLLDFGLARVLDAGPGDDITQAGLPIMTPAYASPEQIRGQADSVSCDVYSLGVIFFELLAGKRPYEVPAGSLTEMVRIVCEQPPRRLSEAAADERARRRLRGDLENIAAKALEKDPRRRYASVGEFAADIRRHRAGLPVRARPATFTYRAGKFLRRHRVAVPAVLAAAALIVAFAGTTWWEARRAERRFEDVHNLAHSVMFELHDAIAPLAGSTAARRLLVARALEYLERLSRESGSDAKLAREVALGYERIGVVQGAAYQSNLGDYAASLESLRKSAAILERLAAQDPRDETLRRDYLRVLNRLPSAYSAAGDHAHAAEWAAKSLALAEADYAFHSGDPAALSQLMMAVSRYGDFLADQSKYQEMVPVRQRALQLSERLAAANPGDANRQRNLALAHKKLAALYGVLNRLDESHDEYEKALAIDLARSDRDTPEARTDLSFDYSDLGWLLLRQGQGAAALQANFKALRLRAALAQADPNDLRVARAVASSTERIAGNYSGLGDLDHSVQWSREAIAQWKKLADRETTWSTVTSLADTHAELAETYQRFAPKKHPELWKSAAAEFQTATLLYTGLRDKGVLPRALDKQITRYSEAAARCRAAASN
ncbi:MAG TPA: protein kinase [Bryobacteraceae bacterium]|nr:protein kinase [Bryobacteraceae bacterium]